MVQRHRRHCRHWSCAGNGQASGWSWSRGKMRIRGGGRGQLNGRSRHHLAINKWEITFCIRLNLQQSLHFYAFVYFEQNLSPKSNQFGLPHCIKLMSREMGQFGWDAKIFFSYFLVLFVTQCFFSIAYNIWIWACSEDIQGRWRYFLGQTFRVLCFEICIPSLCFPHPLPYFKTKHARTIDPINNLTPVGSNIICSIRPPLLPDFSWVEATMANKHGTYLQDITITRTCRFWMALWRAFRTCTAVYTFAGLKENKL